MDKRKEDGQILRPNIAEVTVDTRRYWRFDNDASFGLKEKLRQLLLGINIGLMVEFTHKVAALAPAGEPRHY